MLRRSAVCCGVFHCALQTSQNLSAADPQAHERQYRAPELRLIRRVVGIWTLDRLHLAKGAKPKHRNKRPDLSTSVP